MDLVPGLLMGIAYAAAPGPITVETLRQGVTGGLRRSLAVQAGSALGIVVYALLAGLGADWLLQETVWQLAVGLLGMAMLCGLGLATIRGRREFASQTIDGAPGGVPVRRAFRTGALLSLGNPLDIVFWLSLGSRALSDPAVDALAYFGAFVVGLVAASLLVAIVAGLWPSRLPARAAVAVSWLCGLAFIGFGLQLGLSTGAQLTRW